MEFTGLSLSLIALVVIASPVTAFLPTYFMDEWCSTTLDMSLQGIESGRLLLRPPERGLRSLSCYILFKAPPGKRVSFRFKQFHVEASSRGCNLDHLQLFDDVRLRGELTGRMCNTGQTPQGVYTTTRQDGAIRLLKRNSQHDQIELIFTAFHLSPCMGGEFQCSNAHCIADSLRCNHYDNCGDESDMCLLNSAGVAGVVVAVIVIIIIIIAVVLFVLYQRRKQSERLGKVDHPKGRIMRMFINI